MSIFYNYVKESIWKLSKNLLRDLRELELMQSGNAATLAKFVSRSVARSKEIIAQELKLLNYKSIVFDGEEMPKEDGLYIIINPLDGARNLERSIALFAISATQMKIQDGKRTPLASVLCFPAFSYIIYAENGQGAWLEKYDDTRQGGNRLRSSGESDISKLTVSYSFAKYFAKHQKKNLDFRHFACVSYDIFLFAAGKIDAIYVNKDSNANRFLAQIIAKETGAYSQILESGDIIAVNANITELLKI